VLLIPLFTSLALFCSKELAKENTIASPQWACFLLSGICAACGIFLLPKTDYQSVLSYQKKQEEKAQAAALQIDNLMTSCGYDRYVVFGKGEDSIPYGYTHHSPMGPGFFRTSDTFPVKWRNPPTPYLQNTYRERLHTAPFVIANKIVIDGKPLVDAPTFLMMFGMSLRKTLPLLLRHVPNSTRKWQVCSSVSERTK
jgi:hypothetical protein